MSFRHALATAAAVAALAPSSAFAQGAGDDQYSDPFGGESEQSATPTPAPQRPAATATPAPAQPAQSTATPAPSQPNQNTPAPPSLPYTGIDPWPMALGGALLLGTGLALRIRVERAH